MRAMLEPLPIDPLLPAIVATLARADVLVLEAPPGAGKTTRVPRALLDSPSFQGEIVILEPRRIAARLAARRVAEELGEEVGARVGYQVRFEDVTSAATRVRFVTEGLLTRRLTSDRELRGVSIVLLDEFHERHLHGDAALALLRRLQATSRPDLKLVVMSATLEASRIAEFLGGAPILKSEGKRFDVAIEHLTETDDRPLEKQIASAVRRLVNEELDGDVLVFLPGALEIRRVGEALAKLTEEARLLVVPLHGQLSPAEQDRAVKKADRRKVILATNVAETSVTIDGVVAVVDAGLARVASTSPWSGLPTLKLAKVSRASAAQRAGRAGRTRPGRCLRLYTKGDLLARPEHDAPEIARADLAELALDLHALGVEDARSLAWLTPPPDASLAAADKLLERLGAIDRAHRPTPLAKRLLRFALHPRLARLVVEAEERGVGRDGATIAALLAERDLGGPRRRDARHTSDVIARLADFEDALGRSGGFLGFDRARVDAVKRSAERVARALDRRKEQRLAPDAWEDALAIAILAGYPDRVGRLRRPANATGRAAREIVFATGGTAALAEESGVADAELAVAVDVEERAEGTSRRAIVRMASAVKADWLLELFLDAIADTTEARWNAGAERVETSRRLAYEGLVLEETPGQGDPREAARVLYEQAIARGLGAFFGGDALDELRARVRFARAFLPDLPALDDEGLREKLRAACAGRASFADLRAADLASEVRAELAPFARDLDALAPETFTLPGGRRLRITYPNGEPPFASSRLQDFFGMVDGPKVARGKVPLVLHLLAPNQRAVQVTTDLAGFWDRHYPAIAKELRRRYPRHAWPDDPRTAAPPAPRR